MTRKLTFLILALFALISGPGWGQNTAVLPNTQALTTSFVNVGGDSNIQIKTSSANTYTNPLRFYANVTATINAIGNAKITSITYEAFSTGNYVTYAKDATVTPQATPTVSDKNVTWSYSAGITEFTFTPSTQTRCNSITIEYTIGSSATLESIEVTAAPTKVVYTEGEYFDPTGLVITKYFDDETTSDLAYDGNETAFSFNPTLTTPLATTNEQVEITVGGKSANQAITVNAAPKYTITFMDRTSQVDLREINQGAAVGELPADPDDIGTYKFQGWAEQFEGTVQNAPAFVTSTTVPTSNMTYYAVYAEVSGSGESTTESSTIEAIASANSWQDAQPYSDASFGNITVTGSGTGNNCKYYTSDKSWRFYSSGDGKITFTVPEGNFISNVTLTGTSYFTSAPTGWNYSNNTFTPKNGTNSNTITILNGSGTSKILSFSITYGGGETYSNYTQNPVAKTLVSIEVSGTPAEFWKGDAFNHDGMTVMANWDDESQTDVTADCEFSTPDMATAGEKEITVTYQGQSDTYTINVQTIENTLETAYTVAQAIAIIDAGKDLATKVYVAGKICQIDSYNSTYKSITYWISTDGSEENMFEVYSGKGLNEADFTSINDIVLQADVVVYGNIKKFNDIYEFDKNNYLASYTAPEIEEYHINLHPNEHGTISADLETASAGQIVTLTATPIANYHFVEWTVLDGDANEVSVTNNQFTMPASDVEVEATFEEDESIVFTYHYNGDLYTDGIDYSGTVITLEEDPDMSPEGFSFVGWSTSVASTDVIEGTTYTLNEDVDFYAVFEKQGTNRGSSNFVKVTTEPEDWSGEYLLVYEGDSYNYAWTGVDAGQCHTDVVISDNVIASQPTDAVTLTLATMDGGYSIRVNGGTNDGKYIGKSSYSNGLDIKEIEQLNTLSMDEYGIIIAAEAEQSGVHCTMRYNKSSGDSNERFRYYKSGQEPVQLYKKQGSEPTANRRYTRVYDDVYTFAGTDLNVEGPSIVVSGYTLTVTGTMINTNPANLVIEDGAQLYYTNGENVNATFQKNITGYTGDNDNYYLIANPTDNETVVNLVNAEGYDLYTFNGAAELEWINMKSSPVVANDGIGYLYANSADVILGFAGEIIPAGSTDINLNYANKEFGGFNLIGNPFACNAYVGKSFYVIDGSELVLSENNYVAPCEGFFVEATEANQSVTVSTAAPVTAPNALSLNVSQNRGNVIDRAIVNFNGSNDLHKFMMNPAHTNLSIAKGSETFAAISTEAEGELPVNFKAEKNGTYTITVNTKNVDAEYLHLIDNMTGMDVDLLSTPSYTFEAKTSDYASRFKLVFGVKNEASESSDSNFAFMSNGNLVIDNIEGEATLQIVDELGRVISTETVSGSYSKALNLKAGLYILNLNGMTQKIVVK